MLSHPYCKSKSSLLILTCHFLLQYDFRKYLLSVYCVSMTVLSVWETSEYDKFPFSRTLEVTVAVVWLLTQVWIIVENKINSLVGKGKSVESGFTWKVILTLSWKKECGIIRVNFPIHRNELYFLLESLSGQFLPN